MSRPPDLADLRSLSEPRQGHAWISSTPACSTELFRRIPTVERFLADMRTAAAGGPTPEALATLPHFDCWRRHFITAFPACVRGTAIRHLRVRDGRVANSERVIVWDAAGRWALTSEGFVGLGAPAPLLGRAGPTGTLTEGRR